VVDTAFVAYWMKSVASEIDDLSRGDTELTRTKCRTFITDWIGGAAAIIDAGVGVRVFADRTRRWSDAVIADGCV